MVRRAAVRVVVVLHPHGADGQRDVVQGLGQLHAHAQLRELALDSRPAGRENGRAGAGRYGEYGELAASACESRIGKPAQHACSACARLAYAAGATVAVPPWFHAARQQPAGFAFAAHVALGAVRHLPGARLD